MLWTVPRDSILIFQTHLQTRGTDGESLETKYVLHFTNGKIIREGRGLSFFYFGPNSSIAAIPMGSNDLPFVFNESTNDYQTVSIQGQISYKISNPKILTDVLDYLLVIATIGKGILDVSSLSVEDMESIWIPYAVIAGVMGAVAIVFGVSLIRLQDSMGELSRVAGLLEIVMGCLLITVVLFFVSYVVFIPAVVVEILVLYRGYEYLSRPTEHVPAA